MIQPIVILFLFLGSVFAGAHFVAVDASLYWHFWWFDILMHFWGGILIALGVISLCTFRRVNLQPRLRYVLTVAVGLVLIWELFEWQVGLMKPALHMVDAVTDVLLGLFGSVVGYTGWKRFR